MAGRYIFPFVTGDFLPLSGGTVSGLTIFNGGLSGTSMSAGTIFLSGANIDTIFAPLSALGNYLPLSGGTVTGDTIFTQGVSGGTISGGTYYSGSTPLDFIFAPIGLANQITKVQPGLNTFTGGTELFPSVNVIPNPIFTSVTSQSISGTSISAETIVVGTSIMPTVDNTVDLGTALRRFRSLNTINGVSVNFTATTRVETPEILLGSQAVTENNIILTGQCIDGGSW